MLELLSGNLILIYKISTEEVLLFDITLYFLKYCITQSIACVARFLFVEMLYFVVTLSFFLQSIQLFLLVPQFAVQQYRYYFDRFTRFTDFSGKKLFQQLIFKFLELCRAFSSVNILCEIQGFHIGSNVLITNICCFLSISVTTHLQRDHIFDSEAFFRAGECCLFFSHIGGLVEHYSQFICIFRFSAILFLTMASV